MKRLCLAEKFPGDSMYSILWLSAFLQLPQLFSSGILVTLQDRAGGITLMAWHITTFRSVTGILHRIMRAS